MTERGSRPAPRLVVRFQVDGGFAYVPGLSRPVTIDSADLAPEDDVRLRALLDGAGFFTRPEQEGAPAPGAADYRTYTIAVTEGERSHTVRVIEPIADPALQRLVDHLLALQRRSH